MFGNLIGRIKANRSIPITEKSVSIENETSVIQDIYDLEIVIPDVLFEKFMSTMIDDEPGVEAYQYGREAGSRTSFERIQFNGTDNEAKSYMSRLYDFSGAKVWVKC